MPREIARALIYTNKGKIVIARRPETDSAGGLWNLPGGGRLPKDKSILETASRELQEEVRINVPLTFFQCTLVDQLISVHYFYGHINGMQPCISEEASAITYATLENLSSFNFAFGEERYIRLFLTTLFPTLVPRRD